MSHIDWKKVSKSPGYKSFKAGYIHDIQKDINTGKRFNRNPFRSKEEHYKRFKEIIGIATKLSQKWDISIEDILLHWEKDRGYQWWFRYYSNSWVFEERKPSL